MGCREWPVDVALLFNFGSQGMTSGCCSIIQLWMSGNDQWMLHYYLTLDLREWSVDVVLLFNFGSESWDWANPSLVQWSSLIVYCPVPSTSIALSPLCLLPCPLCLYCPVPSASIALSPLCLLSCPLFVFCPVPSASLALSPLSLLPYHQYVLWPCHHCLYFPVPSFSIALPPLPLLPCPPRLYCPVPSACIALSPLSLLHCPSASITLSPLSLLPCLHFVALSPLPQREAGDVWCLPPVWNLRAVIWFHFAISSLVLLPSPVTFSVLSFSACWPFLLNFFHKTVQYFLLRDRLFLYGSCFAVRRRQLVGGMCSMLPYDTGICCYAFVWYFIIFLLLLSIPFFISFLKSGIDKSMEWSMIPACPSLTCFFNRGDAEGTNSSKNLCPMFVYVLFHVNLCHDWFCGLWIVCGLMTCVQSK